MLFMTSKLKNLLENDVIITDMKPFAESILFQTGSTIFILDKSTAPIFPFVILALPINNLQTRPLSSEDSSACHPLCDISHLVLILSQRSCNIHTSCWEFSGRTITTCFNNSKSELPHRRFIYFNLSREINHDNIHAWSKWCFCDFYTKEK